MNITKKLIAFAFALCIIQLTFGKSTQESFTFIQLTDTQMGFISGNQNCDEEIELYTKAVNFINKVKPKFVVITGDFVNNRTDPSQIKSFKKITSSINKKIPVYLIPGNHDMGQKPTKGNVDFYFRHYKSDKFNFKYGNVQFIGINSSYINTGSEEEIAQYNWLQESLSKNPISIRKIVFSHHPFFIKNIDEKDSYSNIPQPKRTEYMHLFKKSGVVAVFAGHYHNNAEAFYQGIDMVTTSAVGKQLGNAKSGLRIIKVYRDSITHQYVELSNLPKQIQF